MKYFLILFKIIVAKKQNYENKKEINNKENNLNICGKNDIKINKTKYAKINSSGELILEINESIVDYIYFSGKIILKIDKNSKVKQIKNIQVKQIKNSIINYYIIEKFFKQNNKINCVIDIYGDIEEICFDEEFDENESSVVINNYSQKKILILVKEKKRIKI